MASKTNVDPRLLELMPHRPPMLLIQHLIQVNETGADAALCIDNNCVFFEEGKGVPAWIGLEYMGQTAALIAGYQLAQGLVSPHLGFVLGTRRYRAKLPYFLPGSRLSVSCRQLALVGDSLANFACEIQPQGTDEVFATASLAVIRKDIDSNA